MEDHHDMKMVLCHMRFMTDVPHIMIEDIEEVSIEDYISQLEEWLDRSHIEILRLKKILSQNASSDVEGLYGENYDRSLPL